MKLDYDAPRTIYLHRDAAGTVIYVGMTTNLERRTREHRSSSLWGGRIALVEVDSIQPDYRKGARREAELIHKHEPSYNTQHNPAVWRENAAWDELARTLSVPGAMEFLDGRTAIDALADLRRRFPEAAAS